MSLLQDRLARLLPKHRFARSVSILAGGTALAQALGVLIAPLLTRLYAPEHFGILAAFVALLAIVSVVSTLRYEVAIPLPASDLEAAHVLGLCLAAVASFSLVSGLVLLLWGEGLAERLGLPMMAPYLWLLPFGILCAGTYETLIYWAIRVRAFPLIARTKFYQVFTLFAVQLGAFSLGSLGLLLGHMAGHGAGAASISTLIARRRWELLRQLRLSELRRVAYRYRRFPLFSTWSGGFNTLSSHVPPLLLVAFFSPAAAGLYALSHRVLAMPMSMVGQAVSDAFFSEAAEAHRQGRLSGLVLGIYEKLVQIAMPPALLLVLTGPELFALVFGPQWRMGGEFAQWMAPWLLLQFIASPLSLLFDVLERQPEEMAFQLVLLVTRVVALFTGYWIGDLTWTVALFALTSAACYFGKLVWLFKLALQDWRPLCRPLLHSFFWAALLASPVIVADGLGVPLEFWFAGIGLALALIAVRYLSLLKAVW
ncbi:MAG TPA: lipopolysaccharide biosynthesis protein [Kiloniellales bacterium]|nr:lipopolysaccharide biosynthesis protein [Kiloniellales bacterium]